MSETSALATVTVGLRTRRRPVSLTTIAAAISELEKLYGSLNAVSKRAGVSAGMLRKFQSVSELSPRVAELVRVRKIDRVMDVFWLSKLDRAGDQLWLAQTIPKHRLSTAELRDVVTILRRNPREGRVQALHRVIGGRKTVDRAFAVAMPMRRGASAPIYDDNSIELLKRKLPNSGLAIKDRLLVMIFTPEQLASARKAARERNVELTEIANAILVEAQS